MIEKEAREIVKINIHLRAGKPLDTQEYRDVYALATTAGSHVFGDRVNQAKGYLEAIDKAKGLEEFIKYFLDQESMAFMECSQAEDLWCRAKEALAKWEKEK